MRRRKRLLLFTVVLDVLCGIHVICVATVSVQELIEHIYFSGIKKITSLMLCLRKHFIGALQRVLMLTKGNICVQKRVIIHLPSAKHSFQCFQCLVSSHQPFMSA